MSAPASLCFLCYRVHAGSCPTRRALAALALVLTSCTAISSPATCPSSTGDVYDAACANMARLGCSDGSLPFCAVSARRTEEQLGFRFPAPELLRARTRAEVRALGVACP